MSYAIPVTTSSALVLAANEHRKFCILINDSDADIYIELGNSAAVNTGIRISANGFSYEIDNSNLWVGDIYAVHGGSGSKNLLIKEFM